MQAGEDAPRLAEEPREIVSGRDRGTVTPGYRNSIWREVRKALKTSRSSGLAPARGLEGFKDCKSTPPIKHGLAASSLTSPGSQAKAIG